MESDSDSDPAYLDLYHRTSAEQAARIRSTGSMLSRENTAEAYFSTHPDSASTTGYGDAVVHVRVPADWVKTGVARLDDEFELDDGDLEQHFAIRIDRLRPEHFVD